METSSSLSAFLSKHFREYAIDVFKCRHCKIEVHTSEEDLCAAQLCQKCFDARAQYRKKYPFHGGNYPADYDIKAENNMCGDQFGNSREAISVLCASCNNTYDLVPENLKDISIEDQKKRYDAMFAFHKGKKPFDPIIFTYEHAPKGWKNNVLCKQCYDKFLIKHESEILKVAEEETQQREEAAKKKQEEIDQAKTDDYLEKKLWGKILVVSAIVIILVVGLKMCDSGVFYSQDTDDIPYYRH